MNEMVTQQPEDCQNGSEMVTQQPESELHRYLRLRMEQLVAEELQYGMLLTRAEFHAIVTEHGAIYKMLQDLEKLERGVRE